MLPTRILLSPLLAIVAQDEGHFRDDRVEGPELSTADHPEPTLGATAVTSA